MFVHSTQSVNYMQPEVVQDNTVQGTTYYANPKLVTHIDKDLTRDIHHHRDRIGIPLIPLDEFVPAILTGSLVEEV